MSATASADDDFYVDLKTSALGFQTTRVNFGGQDLRLAFSTTTNQIIVPSKKCLEQCTTSNKYDQSASKLAQTMEENKELDLMVYYNNFWSPENREYFLDGNYVQDGVTLQYYDINRLKDLKFFKITESKPPFV